MGGVWREFERFIDARGARRRGRCGSASPTPRRPRRWSGCRSSCSPASAGEHRAGVLDRAGGRRPRRPRRVWAADLPRRMRSFDGRDSPAFPLPNSAPSPSHLDAAVPGGAALARLARRAATAGADGRRPARARRRFATTTSATRRGSPTWGRARRRRWWSRSTACGCGRPAAATSRSSRPRCTTTRAAACSCGSTSATWRRASPRARASRCAASGARPSTPRSSCKSHEPVDEAAVTLHTRGLVPVYPASEALSSRRLRTLVADKLDHAGDRPDALPAEVRARPQAAAAPRRAGGLPPAAHGGRARASAAGGWPTTSCCCCSAACCATGGRSSSA